MSENAIIVKDVTLDGFVGEIVFYKWRGSLVVSTGAGWEHVSVAPYKHSYTPSWDDMCNIKDIHTVYYAYHTMDPLNAVQRLMEAKDIDPDTDCTIEAGVRLLRKIRNK